jgi:hypothetical protein
MVREPFNAQGMPCRHFLSFRSRGRISLTLVTVDGKPTLSLLPKDAANRLQLFDMPAPPSKSMPADATRESHALLLQAGAKAGIPKSSADYIGEGHIVDFIVSFVKTRLQPSLRSPLT